MSAVVLGEERPPLLPPVLTPLLGRETELDEVFVLVDDPVHRLVTITGPGGVGKTRLAVQLAQTLVDEFGQDLVFVSLAEVQDPALVLPVIAQAMGVAPEAGRPIVECLVQAVSERTALLVLDNFEHVLPAAPDVARLLSACRGLTALVTSRAALGVPGEQRYPLSPLPPPEPGQDAAENILCSAAAELFVARARAVRPDFVVDNRNAPVIAEICQRLDGLPLAIELAAARVAILSPEALLARLEKRLQVLGGEQRGVPDRLRTMRHAIAWSHDLLGPKEQRLFRRLSVFVGGFALDAVEAIAAGIEGASDVLDGLGALISHSLVQALPQRDGGIRYAMLETLREFGLERLEAEGELHAAREEHAAYFLRLAEEAESGLTGAEQVSWMDRLDAEWANIASACAWADEAGQSALTLRVFGAIWRFCSIRGRSSEARVLLDRALTVASGEDSQERSRALVAAGNFAEEQRDLAVAHELLDEARAMASRIGERRVQIAALIALGHVARDRGDFTGASATHARAIELAREAGEQRLLASALANSAAVAYYQGDTAAAGRHWQEAREIVAALGDRAAEAVVLGNLGALASSRGDYARAVSLQERALDLARQIGDRPAMAQCLGNLAENLFHLREHARAEASLAESLHILGELGQRGMEAVGLHIGASIAFAQGDLPRAATSLQESASRFVEMGDALAIAESADLLARICAAQGSHGAAIELQAGAAAQRARLGVDSKPVEERENARTANRIRREVSEAIWQRHWRTGSALDQEALAARVLELARSASGSEATPPPEPIETLTRREREVLRLLTEGHTTGEIAGMLYISPRTTTTHIAHIFEKLEVNSRAAAVAVALRAGRTG